MSVENTSYGALAIGEMLKDKKSIFFIGIGGINMSSLADITFSRGYRVGGSDRMRTALTDKLLAAGIEIFYAHEKTNLEGYEAVVYTVAIDEENPEYTEAKKRGLPLISRADYLGYIMMGYPNRIGVSGMHGKSTCTSMCAKVFIDADTDPTVLSGAESSDMGGAYRVGSGRNVIFEACEYMDSFLSFYPSVAIILNIEMDHVDYFKDLDQIKRSFADFAAITGKDGYAIINSDDENVIQAISTYEGHVLSFGIEHGADMTARNIKVRNGRYAFDIYYKGEFATSVELSVSGRHNVYNALATALAAKVSGIPFDRIKRGLEAFRGASRRMEYKGRLNGADVYDDYAHHPTEIKATLEGARSITEGQLVCVYQPHTYSRTAALFEDFSSAFCAADRVIFVDIYAAREINTFGVSSEILAKAVGGKALYLLSMEEAAGELKQTLKDGDLAIIMGAGDVYKTFNYLDLETAGYKKGALKDERGIQCDSASV